MINTNTKNNTMKTLRIEIKNQDVRQFQIECEKKQISISRLNWELAGDHWSITNFTPIDEAEMIAIQSIRIDNTVSFQNEFCSILRGQDGQWFRYDKILKSMMPISEKFALSILN